MTDQTRPAAPAESPEAAALLLATFAELYRQEIGAEEDVHRALPFFGTALGIVVGTLAYAAGRLPRWPDIMTTLGAGPRSGLWAGCWRWRSWRQAASRCSCPGATPENG
jgi:hypothetical protein